MRDSSNKNSLFTFWSQMRRGEKVHPADRETFDRIDPKRHGFRLECLPACFLGRLRTAPVVLLYLSPGFGEGDLIEARSEAGKDHYFSRWRGTEPLRPGRPGSNWMISRTKVFEVPWEIIKERVALLNIGAYHSVDVRSYASLLALPSSRVVLTWAQNVLFPQAEDGKRVVICMRSAAYWGLETGRSYGKGLFAPHVTRSGHLRKNRENRRIVELVHAKLLS